jgi:hypothetical protein
MEERLLSEPTRLPGGLSFMNKGTEYFLHGKRNRMPWNYRIVKTQYNITLSRKKDPFIEEVFTIREVYYDDEGHIILWSSGETGIAPQGTTQDELRDDLYKMLEAFTKPVLTPLDLPGYEYDEKNKELPYSQAER